MLLLKLVNKASRVLHIVSGSSFVDRDFRIHIKHIYQRKENIIVYSLKILYKLL